MLGCAGQTKRPSIRLHPSSNGGVPALLKLPKSECPDLWKSLPRYKSPKAWQNIEEPMVLLERNLGGHFVCRLAVGETIWKGSSAKWTVHVDDIKMAGKKHNQEFRIGLFLSVYVDHIILAFLKQNKTKTPM